MQKMRLHPDLGGDAMHAAMINEAYAILTNPENRAAHDRTDPTRAVQALAGALLNRSRSSRPCPAVHFCGTLNECSERARATEFCGNCRSPLTTCQSAADGRRRPAVHRACAQGPSNYFCTHWPQSEAPAQAAPATFPARHEISVEYRFVHGADHQDRLGDTTGGGEGCAQQARARRLGDWCRVRQPFALNGPAVLSSRIESNAPPGSGGSRCRPVRQSRRSTITQISSSPSSILDCGSP